MLTFDYNPSTRKLLLKTEDLDLFNRVREHFSIVNDAARYGRRYGRYIPPRKYAITSAGACEIGLYWEIKISSSLTQVLSYSSSYFTAITCSIFT